MFKLAPLVSKRFDSFEETFAYVTEEKDRIFQISMEELWNRGARIQEDSKFGIGGADCDFNRHGFQAFCRLFKAPESFVYEMQERGLASRVLNDAMEHNTENMHNKELIIDERTNTIIGIVSNQFANYSNKTFLEDFFTFSSRGNQRNLFLDLSDFGDFKFKEAYSINAQLFLRFTSKIVRGIISGDGGQGEDVSEIGAEIVNSMAGGHAMRLSWYVHRLICANGLVAWVGGENNRVIHRGSTRNFKDRFQDRVKTLIKNFTTAKRMIENLGDMTFDPHKLARHTDIEKIFSIISHLDLKAKMAGMIENNDYSSLPRKEREYRKNSDMVAQIPYYFMSEIHQGLPVFRSTWRDNSSMYDFINIFTEYAKQLPHAQKIETETRAGELASWISQNKRKFA